MHTNTTNIIKKKTNILSRSSNDHNNGDKRPQSNKPQEMANKWLKHRDNSKNNKRKQEQRNNKEIRNKYSKDNTNICSLKQTLT